MSFKSREERTACYKARDDYFECFDKQKAGEKVDCKKSLELFEKSCGKKWTEHFVRRRDYLKFKERLEKEGVDAIDKEKI